jgi:hypothetical protein
MRDFMISRKDEIKFVYNFHSFGNMFFKPYNGQFPYKLEKEYPDISQVFDEITEEAQFPEGMDIGPAIDNLGIVAGGDAADWITHTLGIPAAEAELGDKSDYK